MGFLGAKENKSEKEPAFTHLINKKIYFVSFQSTEPYTNISY